MNNSHLWSCHPLQRSLFRLVSKMEGENIISDSDSKILRIEVEAAIKEVAFAVDYVELSRTLPCTDNLVYFNLRTKESEVFCVELTVQGFRVSHPNHTHGERD